MTANSLLFIEDGATKVEFHSTRPSQCSHTVPIYCTYMHTVHIYSTLTSERMHPSPHTHLYTHTITQAHTNLQHTHTHVRVCLPTPCARTHTSTRVYVSISQPIRPCLPCQDQHTSMIILTVRNWISQEEKRYQFTLLRTHLLPSHPLTHTLRRL